LKVDGNSITSVTRPYPNDLITLKFSTTTREAYLIKEFLSHSPQNLQLIFSELEKIRHKKPHISMPLPSHKELYYFTDSAGRNFQLLKFLNLSPFNQTSLSLNALFNEVRRLHDNLSNCCVPPNHYTDLHEYVVFGVRRIQDNYGADLPFLPQLQSFIDNFPLDSIRQGVRHGDIQETNVYLRGSEVIFVDFDQMHFGHPLMDYIQAAVMYLRPEDLRHPQNQAIVEQLWVYVKEEVPRISQKEVKYLLARVMLGPIQGGDIKPSQAELVSFLNELEHFCERFN
jgi:hypothetical protein